MESILDYPGESNVITRVSKVVKGSRRHSKKGVTLGERQRGNILNMEEEIMSQKMWIAEKQGNIFFPRTCRRNTVPSSPWYYTQRSISGL